MYELIKRRLAVLLEERAALKSALDAVLSAVETEGRTALTDTETTTVNEARAALTAKDSEIEPLREQLSSAEEDEKRAQAAADLAVRLGQDKRGHGPATITNEPRTYTAESAREGRSFFVDAYRAQHSGDWQAAERVQRNAREAQVESRDVGTSAFASLVVPQYLVDLYAPVARAGRPFANTVSSHTLPSQGMTLTIPRGTTGAATASQQTENSAVQETDRVNADLTLNVRTIAGQQDVSRQSLERGTPGIDALVFADLAGAYMTELNRQCLHGTGANGQLLGATATTDIIAVTYTDATPTVGELYAKIADGIQQVNSLRFLPASVIVMHPRRWGFFTAALDTAGRPLVVPTAPQNPVGVGMAAEYGQVVGTIHGLPVVTDASIVTTAGAGTEDQIIIARAADLHLWEDGDGMPRELRFEQTTGGSLTVKLVAYGYSAFTAGRYPKATAVISGTGLIAPTF